MPWTIALIYIFVYVVVIPVDLILRLTTQISLLGALRISGIQTVRALAFALSSVTSIPLFFNPLLQSLAPGMLESPAEFQKVGFEITGNGLSLLGILMVSAAIIKIVSQYVVRHDHMAELITTGAYGIVRNPVYTGMTLIFLGIFFQRPNDVYLLCLVIYAYTNHIRILREERFLEDLFGDQYDAYVKAVGRYMPRPRKWGINRSKSSLGLVIVRYLDYVKDSRI